MTDEQIAYSGGSTEPEYEDWWNRFGPALDSDSRMSREAMAFAGFCAGISRGRLSRRTPDYEQRLATAEGNLKFYKDACEQAQAAGTILGQRLHEANVQLAAQAAQLETERQENEQLKKELLARVAPLNDCVAPIGSTAETSPGEVTPAERPDDECYGW